MSNLSERMRRELEKLALLRDDEINLIDLPEETDWSAGERSRFATSNTQVRNYDVRSIANWFIDALKMRDRSVTNLSLNKLVYFAFERFLVERNVVLTSAKIEAWAHGPVFREVYHDLKEFNEREITRKILRFSVRDRKLVVAHDNIHDSDVSFLEEIANTYGILAAGQLVDISHQPNGPWANVWYYRGRSNPGMEISLRGILEAAPKKRKFDGR